MSRRDKLIGLMCVEALVWLATSLMSLGPAGQPHIRVMIQAPLLALLVTLVQAALLFAPAVWIGALSRQWQGAVALNLIAIAPAFALTSIVGVGGFGGYGSLSTFGIVAALGFAGWLLRFVRVEFAEEGQA